MSNKSTEAGALALANRTALDVDENTFADLTEVLERWGAKGLTEIVGQTEAVIAAALPHLKIEKLDEWKRVAMEEQRRFAVACAALRGAISRLETIRETHGHHIALDRDIEIYREGLPEYLSQNVSADGRGENGKPLTETA